MASTHKFLNIILNATKMKLVEKQIIFIYTVISMFHLEPSPHSIEDILVNAIEVKSGIWAPAVVLIKYLVLALAYSLNSLSNAVVVVINENM
jgi:hypothetical protein